MTPFQKIKWLILVKYVARGVPASDLPEDAEDGPFVVSDDGHIALPDVNEGNVDELYTAMTDDDCYTDTLHEVRGGEVETNVPAPTSRHYESKSVAAKMPDGSWVGWTYWYGGGKYGEPDGMPWMEEAYNLTCVEEEKVVTVRTFTKIRAFDVPPGHALRNNRNGLIYRQRPDGVFQADPCTCAEFWPERFKDGKVPAGYDPSKMVEAYHLGITKRSADDWTQHDDGFGHTEYGDRFTVVVDPRGAI